MSSPSARSDRRDTIELPERVDAGWVERHAELLLAADSGSGGRPHPLRLSVARVTHVDLLGETRLLGVLAQARRQRRDIDIVTSGELNLDAGQPDRLFKLFRDTLAGVVLAQLATTIRDSSGVDHVAAIRRLQANAAADHDGVFRFGSEWAAPMIDVFGGPPPSRLLTVRRRDPRAGDARGSGDQDYASLFVDRVSHMGLGPSADIPIASLVEFSYEAFDNTREHGVTTLDGTPIEGVRFVLQRVINAKRGRLTEIAERVDYPPVSTYLTRLAQQLPNHAELRLVELTVADSGIGIPARVAGTEDIYRGDYADEYAKVDEAFELSTTRRSPRGRGRGLFKMQRAVHKVDGLMTLRTGRVDAHRSFVHGDSGWSNTACAHVPGTSVSMLFPWRPDRQMTLDLSE